MLKLCIASITGQTHLIILYLLRWPMVSSDVYMIILNWVAIYRSMCNPVNNLTVAEFRAWIISIIHVKLPEVISHQSQVMALHLATSKKSSPIKKQKIFHEIHKSRCPEGFKIQARNDTFGKRAVAVSVSLAWTYLPNEIRFCEEIDVFKQYLKTHLWGFFFVKLVNESTLPI